MNRIEKALAGKQVEAEAKDVLNAVYDMSDTLKDTLRQASKLNSKISTRDKEPKAVQDALYKLEDYIKKQLNVKPE